MSRSLPWLLLALVTAAWLTPRASAALPVPHRCAAFMIDPVLVSPPSFENIAGKALPPGWDPVAGGFFNGQLPYVFACTQMP